MDMNLIFNVSVIVVIVAIVGILWYKGKKKQALQIVAYLVDFAENRFSESGTGEFKYNYVITKLYPMLPSILKTILSTKTVDQWIENEVNALQEKLKKEIETN